MKKAFKVILLSQTLIYSSFVSATTCTCGHGSAEANGCSQGESCVVKGIKCQNIPNNYDKSGVCVPE